MNKNKHLYTPYIDMHEVGMEMYTVVSDVCSCMEFYVSFHRIALSKRTCATFAGSYENLSPW